MHSVFAVTASQTMIFPESSPEAIKVLFAELIHLLLPETPGHLSGNQGGENVLAEKIILFVCLFVFFEQVPLYSFI